MFNFHRRDDETAQSSTTSVLDATHAQEPARQRSPLDDVRAEREAWRARTTEMLREADDLARQRQEVTAPAEVLNRRLTSLRSQYGSLATRRDAVAREVEDMRSLAALGLETAGDERERLDALNVDLSDLSSQVASVEGRLGEINAASTLISLREQELRAEARKMPDGLILRQRQAAIQAIHRARLIMLYAVREAVSYNSLYPESAINGDLERQARLTGRSMDSMLPDFLVGQRPIDQVRDGLLEGLDRLLGALGQPKHGPGMDLDEYARSLGIDPEDVRV